MTLQAGPTFVDITADIVVLIRQIHWVVVFVAVNAAEYGVGARGMAIIAGVPFAFVLAAIDRELLVVMIVICRR